MQIATVSLMSLATKIQEYPQHFQKDSIIFIWPLLLFALFLYCLKGLKQWLHCCTLNRANAVTAVAVEQTVTTLLFWTQINTWCMSAQEQKQHLLSAPGSEWLCCFLPCPKVHARNGQWCDFHTASLGQRLTGCSKYSLSPAFLTQSLQRKANSSMAPNSDIPSKAVFFINPGNHDKV